MSSLYLEHLAILQQRYETWMSANGVDWIVIDNGRPQSFYEDDIQQPYRAAPMFRQWLPFNDPEPALVLLRLGEKPRLLLQLSKDFWHQPANITDALWVDGFVIEMFRLSEWRIGNNVGSGAYLGPDENLGKALGGLVNPPSLQRYLAWHRAYKTVYEQRCMLQAAKVALCGHQAVAEAFQQGGSEWQLQLAYLAATGQDEQLLPYPNIIAINEHAAVLHYQQRQRQCPVNRHSLLIDAGASINGYGADISRSYVAEEGAPSSAKTIYSELLIQLERQQQQLIHSLKIGQSYLDVHVQACLQIAGLLEEVGLVNLAAEDQLESGVLQHFFPHGVGHLLGVQTHDVGGYQLSEEGGERLPPAAHPYLRLTRDIETDMVFTIEPGVYFIDSLLSRLKESHAAAAVNWPLVDALMPFGGIRIEDNILMTTAGAVQLSR